MSKRKTAVAVSALPEVTISDYDGTRYLHLGTPWVQGSMRIKKPFDIDLEYVQRMMAWLLLVDGATVPERRAMQLGLGAAAATKFCVQKLGMASTAIELNPQVINVCRQWFKLPPDSDKLQVVLADAGEEIQKTQYLQTVDALQVDLYDHEAAAPVLDSPDFYQHCRALLTEDGCMTVNLFGRTNSYARSLANIVDAFGEAAVWRFSATKEGNTVVLAQRTASRPDRELLMQRAEQIQQQTGLPAQKWMKVFKPVQP
ncbi:MAG: spermidine synthase [Comamonas sp.]